MARPRQRAGKQAPRGVRVRSRLFAEIDEAKLATALALMARRLLEQRIQEDPDPGSQASSASSVEEVA